MNGSSVNWESLDWIALDRLRDRFLSENPAGGNYWTCRSDIENYDFTFAQRIGWKWDSVLEELKLREWTPPSKVLFDWGCGSGIAGRRVVTAFGVDRFIAVQVFDRSNLASEFAAERARKVFPSLDVQVVGSEAPEPGDSVGTLIVSHVLNELDEAGGRALRTVIDRADAVLWVEPGTYADSRSLIAMREQLREQFLAVAPCTHQAACGLIAPENKRHWCHHFAKPPSGIMADSNWVRFAQRAGIDLRSVPYSFLVLERKRLRNPVPGLPADGWSRIIGEPRFYKGFAKILSCQADGARELMLQKRDGPALFKSLRNGEAERIQQWSFDGGRIKAG